MARESVPSVYAHHCQVRPRPDLHQDITGIHSKTLVLKEVSSYFLACVDDDCCMIVRCVEHTQTKHLFMPISVMWEDGIREVFVSCFTEMFHKKKISFQICNQVLLFVRYSFQ